MDSNNENFIIEKEEPLIKNICKDFQTGTLILSDNRNNHDLCDIFGRKKKKFLPNISGIANAVERKNYPLTSRHSRSKNILRTESNNINSNSNFSGKKKYTDYFPTTRRFEGYSKFPRPVVPPYSNMPIKMSEKNKLKLKNYLNQYFENEKSKKNFKSNNENNGLSFLNYDLNEFDTIKYDTQHLLKEINNIFDEYKEIYKYKLNLFKKDKMIKALHNFKRCITDNRDNTIINGRKLKEYNPKIKEEYNIIHGTLQKTITNGMRKRSRYKLKGSNTFYKKNSKIIIDSSKITDYNKDEIFNTIDVSRDLTLGKKIKMNFGYFSYEEEEKKKQEKLRKSEELLKKEENKEENNIQNNVEDKDEENKEINNEEFKEENKEDNKEENVDKEKNIINNEQNVNKIKEEDLSFISIYDKNEKNKLKIKNLNKIISMNENENNLMKGFIREEPKEKYISKFYKPKLKTNGQLFVEDIELLKKTNPLAFKLEEKIEERNLKQLEKKMKALRINVNNANKAHNKK